MLALLAEPSLPLMVVVSIVSTAIGASVSATLAVVGFVRGRRELARAVAAIDSELYGDEKRGDPGIVREFKEIKEWKRSSEQKHNAVKRAFESDPDHPIHQLWPDSNN